MPFVKTGTVPPENALNAVLYCRYSSTQQTENSIDGQLRECRRFADYHGYKIIGEYIDRAKSGTSVEQRDDFLRMVGDAKKQQFAFVIVYRFDRFARNRYDSVVYKRQLAISGVRVISATEAVADGPDGAILEAMYEAMDESYSRRLSAITLRGIQEAARKGIWCSAIPFGYRTENKRLIIDEKEAAAVREIYTQYAAGKTKTEIANWLNSHGYRTHRGNPFTCNNFNTILSNPVYIGTGKCREIDVETPAILDKDLYDAVQNLLAKNAPARGRKTDKRYFALTGKLYCGLCGCAMTSDLGTSQNGTVHAYYSCSRRKTAHGVRGGKCKKKSERQDFLEWYIVRQTMSHVLTDTRIAEISERLEKLSREDQASTSIREIEARQKEINCELDDLTDKLISTSNQLIISRINTRADELAVELAALDADLSHLRLQVDHSLTAAQIAAYLRTLRNGDPLDPDFRRRIIDSFIQRVYLFDDKILVYYNIKETAPITYDQAIDDLDGLSAQLSSGCAEFGSPNESLPEHILFIYSNNTFGSVIRIER